METTLAEGAAHAGTEPRPTRMGRWRSILDEAEGWDLPDRTVVAIAVVPGVLAVMGAGSALLGEGAFKAFTGEDGFAEVSQVLLYALAAVLSLVVCVTLRRRGERRVAQLYGLLFAALVFVVGEELSWGQRIVGWTTPEPLAAVNKQDETTIHNLEAVATAFKWVQLTVGAYGGAMPLVVRRLRRRRPDRPLPPVVDWVVPPVLLAPYFLGLAVWRVYRNVLEAPRGLEFAVSEFNEVFELILACGFALMCAYQLRRARRLPGGRR